MRTLLFIIAISLSIIHCQLSLAQQTQRGMKPVSITVDGKAIPLYAQSHALLIGASAYDHGLPPLPEVVNDINAVKRSLENAGFNTIVVMNPDNLALTRAFTDFIARYGQGANNRLLIYYAGHGYTEKMPYGDDIGYICPVDAPDPHKDPVNFQTKAIPMRQIETYAYQIKSKHALFLFDACFSGSIFSTSRAIPEAISYKTKEAVRQFITSGSANETVPDKSVFRSQLVRALNGEADVNRDGFLTGTELGEFLQTTVVNYTSGYQHPQYGKIRNANLDKGDFVFVMNKPAAGATISSAGGAGTGSPSITVEETSLVRYGRLELTTEIGGELYIDDVFIKNVNPNTLVTLNNIAEGNHKLAIKGDEPAERDIEITANNATTLKIDKRRTETAMANIPEMVLVTGGSFQMGSNESDDEKPVHPVTVSDFYIGKYEVTLAQFKKFVDETAYQTDAEKGDGSYVYWGSKYEKRGGVNWRYDVEGNIRNQSEYNHPVIHVSWNDAVAYGDWLSRKTGKSYRLPTEAEWEYAAKGGHQSRGYTYSGSNNIEDVAWYTSNSGSKTHPVGQKQPNESGLYDMTGNVWEWCSDWYGKDYYAGSPSYNPKGPSEGSYRVFRGGSWNLSARGCRTANRFNYFPGSRNYFLGFRLVLVP